MADEDSDGELVGFEQPREQYGEERGPVSPEWLDMYRRLQQYKEQYGDCNVPRWASEVPAACLGPSTYRV